MTCPSVEELAALYDGVLPEKRATRLRLHLCQCYRCSREIKVLDTLMGMKPNIQAPPDTIMLKALQLEESPRTTKKIPRYRSLKNRKKPSTRR